MEKNKKRNCIGGIVYILLYLIVGAIIGITCSAYLDGGAFQFLLLFVFLYLSVFINTIIHELGHLIFGLLTGYRFVSFRLFNLFWLKKEGKIKLYRYGIPGTMGQCLLRPTVFSDSVPFVLYNLGGAIMNFLLGGISAVLFMLSEGNMAMFFLINCLLSICMGIQNAVPMSYKYVDNDGKNIINIKKSISAKRAFLFSMEMNALQTEGVRMRDIPDELMEIPGTIDCNNPIMVGMLMFKESKLLDSHKYDEVRVVVDFVMKSGLPEDHIYYKLLTCDRIYIELIGEGNREVIDSLYNNKAQLKFMRMQMISVIRTLYAYALLYKGDMAEAESLKEKFEKIVAKYPYKQEVESEREYMNIAYEKYAGR